MAGRRNDRPHAKDRIVDGVALITQHHYVRRKRHGVSTQKAHLIEVLPCQGGENRDETDREFFPHEAAFKSSYPWSARGGSTEEQVWGEGGLSGSEAMDHASLAA